MLLARQNLPMGLAGGLVAAVIGAVVWAVVTVSTHFQIGWMAVGVGFLVGYAVRALGKGVTQPFQIIGAVCALLGCLLGNLLSDCGFVAAETSEPLGRVVVAVLTHPAAAVSLLGATFSPMDLLFYGIAIYEGFKLSVIGLLRGA